MSGPIEDSVRRIADRLGWLQELNVLHARIQSQWKRDDLTTKVKAVAQARLQEVSEVLQGQKSKKRA